MGTAHAKLLSWGWVACLVAAATPVESAQYQVAAAPSWAHPITVDADAPIKPSQASRGGVYLLVDREVRIDGNERTSYRHYVEKALDDKGVDRIAHVEIEFDPAYQALTLHAINLLRNGRVIAKLPSTRIKLLQRERELESRIYDGTMTATAFLEDVRAGDAVEVAYSVKGWNPVFKGRQFGNVELQWEVPVVHLRHVMTLPATRDVSFIKRNTRADAVVTELGNGQRQYAWELRDIPAMHVERSTPEWFNPYAFVQWSEFKGWGDVARWAEPLYALPDMPAPAVKKEIDRIVQGTADEQSRLLATLAFVQTEIRYMGVEVGPGSHAPNPPALVLQRRYGDCKDKALLTMAMLHGMGIAAHPALVDTRSGRILRESIPSPGAFNHVIVVARVGNQDYWIDPTRSPQRGDLKAITQADFGQALVLDGRSTDLTPLPKVRADADKRIVNMHFDARQGEDAPVTLTITSIYDSRAADEMRERLTADRLDEMQEQYLNFYARSYPKIKVRAPMSVDDDEKTNRLTVTESYRIAQFWHDTDSAHSERGAAELYAPDMLHNLEEPKEPLRKTPLAMNYPNDFTVNIEADLPGPWAAHPGSWTVLDPAFRFTKTVEYVDGDQSRLRVKHEYQSLDDHVDVRAMPQYVAHLSSASDMVGYSVKNSRRKVTGLGDDAAWWRFIAALLALSVGLNMFIAFARRHFTRKRERAAADAPRAEAAITQPAALGDA